MKLATRILGMTIFPPRSGMPEGCQVKVLADDGAGDFQTTLQYWREDMGPRPATGSVGVGNFRMQNGDKSSLLLVLTGFAVGAAKA